jgi:hypothetical protein
MRHDLHGSLIDPRLFAVVLWRGQDTDAQPACVGVNSEGSSLEHLFNQSSIHFYI